MDITKSPGPDETDADRDVHSKEDGKLLNPTKEHYAEVNALLDWLNRSFYKGELALPMATFVTDLECFGVYVRKGCNHKSGASGPGFRLNAFLFHQSGFDVQCMELLHLMEHARQNKPSRVNYHDLDFAAGMKAHGLQTHRVDAPDKECGERVTHSVISSGKFEKLIAKKGESFAFSWTICSGEDHAAASPEEGKEKESKSGRKFKYECPVEGCDTAFWGKDGQKGGCFEHDPPVPLKQVD